MKAALSNRWIRFLGPLAVLLIAIFLLRDQMPFLGEGYIHVRDANKTGLILAFIAVLLSLGCMAEVMKLLLRAGGNRIRLRDTLILTLVSNA